MVDRSVGPTFGEPSLVFLPEEFGSETEPGNKKSVSATEVDA